MSVARWRRPRYLLSLMQHLGPISLMDSQQHDFLCDKLDDDFTVSSDTQLDAHDNKWVDSRTPGADTEFDVIAALDNVEFDVTSTSFQGKDMRWEGAKGDEIELDMHRGDQAGVVDPKVLIRDQGSATGSMDNYTVGWDDFTGGAVVVRWNGNSPTKIGSDITHTWAKDTTQHWRVVARTMADRVRIYIYVDGTLLATRDDTSASRWPVVGFCGIGAQNEFANTSGVKTSYDNLVIRSTPLVYDDEFDYVTSDSDLDAEDDWTRWRGVGGTDFLEMNAVNDRIQVVTASGFETVAYYWTAPSGQHPAGIELDLFSGNANGTETVTNVNIRHDGGTQSTAKYYECGFNHQAGGAGIAYQDRAVGRVGLLDLTTASPSFTPAADTLYHVVFWAETIDASTVRLHLAIDDQYWTVDDTAAARLVVDGRVGMLNSQDSATGSMYWDNIRIYDSPPKLLLGPAGQEWVRHADDFTVGATVDLDVHDTNWVDLFGGPSGTGNLEVDATNDAAELDAPVDGDAHRQIWRGAKGDVIEADVTLGDQAGDIVIELYVRADETASPNQLYRVSYETGLGTLGVVFNGPGGPYVVGVTFPFAWTKGTTKHLKLWCENLTDRVRIHWEVDGQTFFVDDTDADRLTLTDYCGFGGSNATENTSGIRSAWDNLVISNRARAVDKTFARSPTTGAESFDVKLAQPGGTPGAGSHTLIVRAREV